MWKQRLETKFAAAWGGFLEKWPGIDRRQNRQEGRKAPRKGTGFTERFAYSNPAVTFTIALAISFLTSSAVRGRVFLPRSWELDRPTTIWA